MTLDVLNKSSFLPHVDPVAGLMATIVARIVCVANEAARVADPLGSCPSCLQMAIFAVCMACLIALLLARSGPSAITGFVITAVIDAVKRGTFWPEPHIQEKYFEVGPALTDCDSTPAISRVVGVKAAITHGAPALVSGTKDRVMAFVLRRMGGHREPILSGVMGQAVSAALPSYFSRRGL